MAKIKFSIITPCFNAERHIYETVHSVVNQTAVKNGKALLEYIIVDGQSQDSTLNIIDSFNHESVNLISEKDSGMYDALAKGLRIATGDICSYINAGDYYSIHAFDVLLDFFEQHQNANWVTGLTITYNDKSQVVECTLPFKYRKRFFEKGLYGNMLRFVQQESTFWRCSLNRYIDFHKLASFKLAGDFYIWYQFSKFAELKILQAYIGGFRFHKGQLSENRKGYFKELEHIVKNPSILDWIVATWDRFMWHSPRRIKKLFNKDHLYIYNHTKDIWE